MRKLSRGNSIKVAGNMSLRWIGQVTEEKLCEFEIKFGTKLGLDARVPNQF